jgi:hypothetical protein
MMQLPNDAYLQVDQEYASLRLFPEIDGARIVVRLKAWTQYHADKTEQFAVDLATNLKVGSAPDQSTMKTLTSLRSEELYYTNASPGPVQLVGHVSAAALREVEDLRNSGDLWIALVGLRGVTATGTPARLQQTPTGLSSSYRIRRGEWCEELEAVTDATYVDVLIPVTNDPELAIAAGRVRKARDLIRSGEFNACATELRQALEAVRAFYRTLDVYSAACQEPDKGKHTESQRYALVVQGMFNWLTTFIHDDKESIEGVDMDREQAVQAYGTIAGILHRLAREKASVTP